MGMPEGIVKTQFNPSTIPPNGVFISSNAKIFILNEDEDDVFEVVRCERAVIRWSNNTGLFLETGKQHGTTYVGNFDVSGSFTRPFLNFADARLIAGSVGGKKTKLKGDKDTGVLAGDDDKGNFSSDGSVIGSFDLGRYPLRKIIARTIIDEEGLIFGPLAIDVHKALFSNASVQFDATGLIRSGPMDYVGSYVTISKEV